MISLLLLCVGKWFKDCKPLKFINLFLAVFTSNLKPFVYYFFPFHGILKDLRLFVVGGFSVCCGFWFVWLCFFFSFLGGNTEMVCFISGEAFFQCILQNHGYSMSCNIRNF